MNHVSEHRTSTILGLFLHKEEASIFLNPNLKRQQQLNDLNAGTQYLLSALLALQQHLLLHNPNNVSRAQKIGFFLFLTDTQSINRSIFNRDSMR